MGGKSKIAIYGAIIANTLIAISKFIASSFTGSSALLAEGIHSIIDTGNGLLLLLGIRRSELPADKAHPFGYGKEIYFWSFVVSILIFALGGGFAIYEGIHALNDPKAIENPWWNYAVLMAAIIFEGTSLYIALREFNKSHKTGRLLSNIIKSKDPAKFAVIVEDSAAIIGLVIALLGVFLSIELKNPHVDGIASLLIGVLLLGVATFLAGETKGLLLGESANAETLEKIERILRRNKNIVDYSYPKTMHFGPDSILIVIELDIKDHLDQDTAENTIRETREEIKRIVPKATQVYIHTRS